MMDYSEQTVGLVSLVTEYFDLEAAQSNLDATRELLSARYRVVGPERLVLTKTELDEAVQKLAAADVDALVLQIGTFPDGEAPPLLAQTLGAPIVVHSVPEPDPTAAISLNSLCGANATTFTLTAIEHPHVAVHAPADSPSLITATDAAVLASWMKTARVGLVGSHPGGFYPSAFDEVSLRKTFGLTVEHASMEPFYPNDERQPRRAVPGRVETHSGRPLSEETVADLEHRYAVTTTGMEQLSHLEAVAFKDWPELWGMWPVLGWMQDDGYTIAVEGDMHGAVTMLVNQAFTDGSTQLLADLSAYDPDASTITLWHYGAATKLAREQDSIRYDDTGQMVQFPLKPGRATLARVGTYRGRYRILTVDVEILDEDVQLQRAAGLAHTLNTPADEVIRTMLDDGWEHHLIMSYGETAQSWKHLAQLLGIEHRRL